jgi:excisionase family DNA binding protein
MRVVIAPATNRWMTPPAVAELLGCDTHKILAFIKRGELPAVDLSIGRQRPRYRISPEALEQFLIDRQVKPPATKLRRRKRPVNLPHYV